MVKIGIVGVGFMGVTHFKAMAKVRGGRVSAIVTRDKKKGCGDWSEVQGNFGGSGGRQDLSKTKVYSSLDELLEDPKIDVVSDHLGEIDELPSVQSKERVCRDGTSRILPSSADT